MPTIQYVQGQPFLIPDEVTELPTGTQPALPVTQDWYPAGYDNQPQAAPLPAQPDMWANIVNAGKKLLGSGAALKTDSGESIPGPIAAGAKLLASVVLGSGENRAQLWPERTLRSGISLADQARRGEVLTGPGLRREDFTDIPPSQEPQTWIGKKLGLPAVPEQPLDPLIERAQDIAGLAGGTAFSNVALRGAEKNALGIVPVAKARELNIKQAVPSEILKSAVENTPGANIEPDGLVTIKVARKQTPDQEMSESVRGGVFYLPEGDKNLRHYGTARSYYGGQQKIEGDTAFKNPLVVKGATGGKAPEAAYSQIAGKDGFKQLDNDVMKIVSAKNWMQRKDPGAFEDLTNRFFEKYAPELAGLKDYIFENSSKGNQLRYALQEAAIGSAVRKAGYDGILGYSLKRGADKGKPFISEIFDVRENRYPGVAGDYSIHPTLLSETSKVGAPLAALEKAPMFYSNVENAVKASKQNVASKEQWLSYLKNQPGVKPEELEWTVGSLPEGKITKQQLEQHIAENKVKFNEVWKGDKEWIQLQYKDTLARQLEGGFKNILDQFKTPADVDIAKKHNIHFAETVKGKSNEEVFKAIQEAKELPVYPDKLFQRYDTLAEANEAVKNANASEHVNVIPNREKIDTKYSSYQLPGGENYRELLLTLPEKDLGPEAAAKQIFENFGRVGGGQTWEQLAPETRQSYIDQAKEQGIKATPENMFKSSHWDEPNVLAHVRMNDRNIPDVGKSLHIEEIQSDWHQAGRKQGYIEKDIMDRSVIKNKMKEIENKAPSGLDGMENAQWLENQHDYVRLRDEYNRSLPNNENRVPNAPFKKTWDELALKRTINEAVRNGYDAISWTPGEAQAARYDLSKHIDELHYQNKTNTLTALDHNGRTIIDEVVPKEKVSDYIGKEAAEKLFKTKPDKTGQHLLEGADLKVGGEGMKAFYDKMMVDKANALAKKYGVKVETKDLNTNHDASLNEPFENRSKAENVLNKGGKIYAVSRSGEHLVTSVKELKELEADGYGPFYQYILGDIQPKEPVHVLKLTPELKKAVSEKGFPLFTGGIPHVPPPEEPTFDERWRDRVPDEMMKRDEIKDLLEQQKIRNLPLDYTPPERKFEGRPVHLTKVNFTPEF